MENNSHKKKISKNEKIIIVKNAIKPFLFMTVLAIIFANIILFIYNKSEKQAIKGIEQHSVEMPAMSIKESIKDLSFDVFILANQKHIAELWKEDKTIDKNLLYVLSENFLAISKFKKNYDQVRLIDDKGLEVIRINFNNGSPYIVPKKNLQNKKGRYYFDDAFNLQKDEIFISPLDLNIEKKKVDQALKPMIRVATPIFNERGKKSGIVILNYFGAKLIKRFKNYPNTTKTDNLMLLNSDGYWLSGANPDDEWGFMFEDKKDRTFANRYPKAWKTINSQKSGQCQTQAGLFTFETIFLLVEGQISSTGTVKAFSSSLSKLNSEEYYWKIVSFIPTKYFKSKSKERLLIAIYSLIVFSVLFLYVSILFSINQLHRKIAETTIKDSEKKYRNIFDHAPVGIIIIDKEGNPISGNNRVLDILGSPSMEATKQINVLKLNKLIENGFSDDFIQCINTGKIIQNENYYTSKWNITKYIKYILAPIMHNGIIMGAQAIFEDATERKNAEGAFKDSESNLRQIINLVPHFIYVKDEDGRDLIVNQAVADAYGKTIEDIVNKSDIDITPDKENAPKYIKDDLEVINSGKKKFIPEEKFIDSKGNIRLLETIKIPFKTSMTEKRAILGISIDITLRRESEAKLIKLSAAVTQSPSTIVITDIKGNLEYVNPIFTELTGYNLDETKKINASILKAGTLSDQFYKDLWETISSGKIWHGEFYNKKKNGELFWESASISPILNSENKIINYIKVAEDITEKKRTESELLKMEKLKSIGTLAGGIAHDFNNILTGIYGNVSIALMKLEESHPSYHFLAKTEKSINRATQLTRQLLTFTKEGTPVKKNVNLTEIITETVIFDLSGSNVKPVFNFTDNLMNANVDKSQMQQVFSNLTINAAQASPEGGHLYISVVNSFVSKDEILDLKSGKYLKIEVQDEGSGIPQKYIDKIFEPYFTTKQKGSGLGLATTYSIIKKHSGYIEIDSELGKGTTFTIYLPASKNEEIKNEEKSKIINTKKNHSAKILIMDDDKVIREMSSQMIKMLGYKTASATDGKQTITLYEEAIKQNIPFDVIIMDLTIPGGMGGKETVKKILEINKDAKVIVSSGYISGSVLADYKIFGFVDMIDKPYTMINLKEVLDRVLNV